MQRKTKIFHRAKKKYNIEKNIDNRECLKAASKSYKQELSRSFATHQLKLEKELRQTSKTNTKEFWNILNKFSKKQKHDTPIPLNTLYEYFKNMNCDNEHENDNFQIPHFDVNEYDNILNGRITEDEIKEVIKKLKNNKAEGFDNISNEYIKHSMHVCLPLYVKLFNFMFDAGITPEKWSLGIIHPIYKNKGDPQDPDSYRGITLVSCLGKVYTAIINERLNSFANSIELITKLQAGFRKGYSTVDNIFCLYSLIQLYFLSNRKLFCTFVDFRKAFDTIWRVGLWQKIIASNITGKIFITIFNLYSNIKSCVRQNAVHSEFFVCQMGVRQGENLSPFLFAIYINDLETFFIENNIECLQKISEYAIDQMGLYLKLFLLLYADDTILISESATGMQRMLNVFDDYCTRWKLSVNLDKTNVVIFEKRKCRRNVIFKMKGEEIKQADSYTYLGLLFNYNCSFFPARKKLMAQANKALFALNYKIRNVNIPIDLQLKLFDCLITPILLYSSEIWSYENIEVIERFHLKFLKQILNVRSTTPSYMVYGETGRYPLIIYAKIKCLCYWSKVLSNGNSKLSGIMYHIMYNCQRNENVQFKWINDIKNILDDSGFSYLWNSQISPGTQAIKSVIKQRLVDQFYQKLVSEMEQSSRGRFYLTFKIDFNLEKYQTVLKKQDRNIFCRFRCSNLKLPVEIGRWRNIPYENRQCPLCDSREVGDEFHYFFICKNDVIRMSRGKYIPNYYTNNPSAHKMKGLLSLCNKNVIEKLCTFLKKLDTMFKEIYV